MDANLPRWIFQSIASHFQPVAADLSLPFLVEGIDERSDETMHSDHVELRVTGPTVKEISRGYYDTDTVINFLFTKAMDPVDTNAYDLIQWTGSFASEMLLPIPIYKRGSGPDDDNSFISCLRIAKGKKEAARIYHFGQLDKDTPVRQSEVDAVFSMDYYSSLVINPPQLVFSVLALTSSVVGEKTRPAATTMNLTSSVIANKLLNHSVATTMNLDSDVVGVRTCPAATTMNLTDAATIEKLLNHPAATTMNLTDTATIGILLNRSAATTMTLNSDATRSQLMLRPAATTMNLNSSVLASRLLSHSAATTMSLTSDAVGIIPNIITSNITHPMALTSVAYDASFRSTWNTSNTSAGSSNTVQVALPLTSDGSYNFFVDWGDSTSNTITAYGDSAKLHTYASSGNYTINITGEIQGWQFANAGDKEKIQNISNWGVLNLANPSGVAEDNFYGCTNLTINASDAIDLTDTTSLDETFNNCDSIVSGGVGMDTWDTSSINSLTGVFRNSLVFNADIGSWNTTNTTNMSSIFRDCPAFNQDIGSWNTAKTTNMTFMFYNCNDFDQDISSWNTANTTNMIYLFNGCTVFNADIGNWNTANVTSMSQMFKNCVAFNQDIGSWNTANVTDLSTMFNGCNTFNQNIGSWNTTNTTNMYATFYNCNDFNQDISSWNTANVVNVSYMFSVCDAFNQDIGSWNTANITNMSNMFNECAAFDQDLSGWDITSLTNATNMFLNTTLSTANYDALLIAWGAQLVQPNVTFHGGNATYTTAGKVGRDALEAEGWTITDGGHTDSFSSTWNTSNTSGGSSNTVQVALPLVSDGSYNFFVDWGDSTSNTITAYGDAAKTHTYASSGNYTINITGEIQGWQFANAGDKEKIQNISNWGVLNLANPSGVAEDNFQGCTNLTITAGDAIDLTDTTSFDATFNNCESLVGGTGMNNWDTSNITSLTGVFRNCDTFNADVSSWDTANTTNMTQVFFFCPAFNQDIGSWNTHNTTNMDQMFWDCTTFNQDIGSWNTANVTNMSFALHSCTAFNQDIGSWNTHNTTNMAFMFRYCIAFNQDIGSWNTANMTNMSQMFNGCTAFDQDLSGWEVPLVTNMASMFLDTTLSTTNYSALLSAWGAGSTQNGVTFHGGNATYNTVGEIGRDILLSRGWAITDGGGPV